MSRQTNYTYVVMFSSKIFHQFVYLEDEKTPEFYELYKYKLIRDYSYSILKDDPKNPFIKKYIEIIRS